MQEHRDPQVLAEKAAAKKIRTVGRPEKESNGKVDIINSKSTAGGTSAAYLTARIARDKPEILEEMKARNISLLAENG